MKRRHWLGSLLVPLLVLAAWEWSVRQGWLNQLFFPSPSMLVGALPRLWTSGELQRHLGATLVRLHLGAISGGIAGLALGVAMGRLVWLRRIFEPVLSGLFTTPKIAILPLLMLFVGIGEWPRLLLIALAAGITMAMQTMDAVRNFPVQYLRVAQSWKTPRSVLLRRILLPGLMPQLATGVRMTMSRALLTTSSLEFVSCPEGLGAMIWLAWQTLDTESLYWGVILSGLLGFSLHAGFRLVERRLGPAGR